MIPGELDRSIDLAPAAVRADLRRCRQIRIANRCFWFAFWLLVALLALPALLACSGQSLDDWTHAAIPTERPWGEPTGDLTAYVLAVERCAPPDFARFRQLDRPLGECVADSHCVDAETEAIAVAPSCSEVDWPQCRPWLAIDGCETEAQ